MGKYSLSYVYPVHKVGLHLSPQGPLVAVQPAMPTSSPPITPDVVASIAAAVAAREGHQLMCDL